MTQKFSLILLQLQFFNTCYLVALISESCESLVLPEWILRSSIPVGLIYHILPSLWHICIFTGGLIVPSQSTSKNLMPLLLCELIRSLVFYKSQTLPV